MGENNTESVANTAETRGGRTTQQLAVNSLNELW